ncbi:DUF397 domain-containing protein [Actinokineospora sp.]|uniref:DUF397 domain-containing protein n=1 Tax=Actinokineospora sp. TaxID=1872133 RepID=UPI003D6B172C
MVVWRKASRSGSTSNCIQVSNTGQVRDSKNPSGGALSVDLAALVAAAKFGRVTR